MVTKPVPPTTPSATAPTTCLINGWSPAVRRDTAIAPANAASIGGHSCARITASICLRAFDERGLSETARLKPRSAASHLFAFLSSRAMRRWAAAFCGSISRASRKDRRASSRRRFAS